MLTGKTAVITGGARGIGAAIAKKFASLGANVAILYRGSTSAAEQVVQDASAQGVKAKAYQCDVSDATACNACAKEILEDFGTVTILVNNAGITRDGLLAAMSEEMFTSVLDTNLMGCFHMIRAFSRNFMSARYGKIINIASVSGILGTAGQCNYAAAKAGIIALTKTAAREFGARNVCVNAIAPGFIVTDMTENLDGEKMKQNIPLKRLGTPEDVANLAVFLADNVSDYITGETLRVDGGMAI